MPKSYQVDTVGLDFPQSAAYFPHAMGLAFEEWSGSLPPGCAPDSAGLAITPAREESASFHPPPRVTKVIEGAIRHTGTIEIVSQGARASAPGHAPVPVCGAWDEYGQASRLHLIEHTWTFEVLGKRGGGQVLPAPSEVELEIAVQKFSGFCGAHFLGWASVPDSGPGALMSSAAWGRARLGLRFGFHIHGNLLPGEEKIVDMGYIDADKTFMVQADPLSIVPDGEAADPPSPALTIGDADELDFFASRRARTFGLKVTREIERDQSSIKFTAYSGPEPFYVTAFADLHGVGQEIYTKAVNGGLCQGYIETKMHHQFVVKGKG